MILTKLQMRQLHKPKGNIILLALFVLLASGVIGILISMMMKDFLRYHNSLLAYHKASSLAKGAGELALAMIYKKPWGFDYTTSLQNKTEKEGENSDQTSNFLTQNFTCPFPIDKEKQEVCPVKYGFDLEIKGTEELKGEQISLPAGGSHIVVAFILNPPNKIEDAFWKLKQKDSQNISINNISKNIEEYIKTDWADDKQFFENKQQGNSLYFIVSNRSNTKINKEQWPKITSAGKVSSETISITAKGNYQGTIVEKQISAKNGIPDFLKGDNYLLGQEWSNN